MNFQIAGGQNGMEVKCANPDFLQPLAPCRHQSDRGKEERWRNGSNVRNKLDFQPNGSNWKERKRRERDRQTEKVGRILKGGPNPLLCGTEDKRMPRTVQKWLDFPQSGSCACKNLLMAANEGFIFESQLTETIYPKVR